MGMVGTGVTAGQEGAAGSESMYGKETKQGGECENQELAGSVIIRVKIKKKKKKNLDVQAGKVRSKKTDATRGDERALKRHFKTQIDRLQRQQFYLNQWVTC